MENEIKNYWGGVGLPEVGQLCRYKLRGGVNWFDCKIIAYHNKHVWVDKVEAVGQPLIRTRDIMFDVCLVNKIPYKKFFVGGDYKADGAEEPTYGIGALDHQNIIEVHGKYGKELRDIIIDLLNKHFKNEKA